MKNVIRVGDPTSHGGVVQTGDSTLVVEGKPVARVGDTCTCPMSGHQNCVIVEGNSTFTVGGRQVAFDGYKTSCGATLQSTLSTFGAE